MNELALDIFRVDGGLEAVLIFKGDKNGVNNFLLSRGSRMREVKFVKMK